MKLPSDAFLPHSGPVPGVVPAVLPPLVVLHLLDVVAGEGAAEAGADEDAHQDGVGLVGRVAVPAALGSHGLAALLAAAAQTEQGAVGRHGGQGGLFGDVLAIFENKKIRCVLEARKQIIANEMFV